MSNNKRDLIAVWEQMRAQTLEVALSYPPRVGLKLKQNVDLIPSKWDFDSNHEEKYRPEINHITAHPDASDLVDKMRLVRQQISNLEFKEEQDAWPPDTMTI